MYTSRSWLLCKHAIHKCTCGCSLHGHCLQTVTIAIRCLKVSMPFGMQLFTVLAVLLLYKMLWHCCLTACFYSTTTIGYSPGRWLKQHAVYFVLEIACSSQLCLVRVPVNVNYALNFSRMTSVGAGIQVLFIVQLEFWKMGWSPHVATPLYRICAACQTKCIWYVDDLMDYSKIVKMFAIYVLMRHSWMHLMSLHERHCFSILYQYY